MVHGIKDAVVEDETEGALQYVIGRLRESRAPDDFLVTLESLARQVRQPCVVAVAGPMNAGKSTFINALLQDDCAIVGSTETTATINHFIYGHSAPGRPVICHWRGGQRTEEGFDFLSSLQGNDMATLERSRGIEFLEYRMTNAILRDITVVDTPGTGAAVREREDRTAAFLKLESELRSRHSDETRQIAAGADAVIYLVGAIARVSDHELLQAFVDASAGKSNAMNALGVIGKIDLSVELADRAQELAKDVASQLGSHLNTVVPVSAAVARTVDRISYGGGLSSTPFFRIINAISGDHLSLLFKTRSCFVSMTLKPVRSAPKSVAQCFGI